MIIARTWWSKLSNTHLHSERFKSSGNSVVFKKRNNAKLSLLKSYLAIKISFIRKLRREKTHQKNKWSSSVREILCVKKYKLSMGMNVCVKPLQNGNNKSFWYFSWR